LIKAPNSLVGTECFNKTPIKEKRKPKKKMWPEIFGFKKKKVVEFCHFPVLYTWQHVVSGSANGMTWQKAQSKSRIHTHFVESRYIDI